MVRRPSARERRAVDRAGRGDGSDDWEYTPMSEWERD